MSTYAVWSGGLWPGLNLSAAKPVLEKLETGVILEVLFAKVNDISAGWFLVKNNR